MDNSRFQFLPVLLSFGPFGALMNRTQVYSVLSIGLDFTCVEGEVGVEGEGKGGKK